MQILLTLIFTQTYHNQDVTGWTRSGRFVVGATSGATGFMAACTGSTTHNLICIHGTPMEHLDLNVQYGEECIGTIS